MSEFHYFDFAATTKPDSDILQAALDFSMLHWANPSSVHAAGLDAKAALEECRTQCAKILGVKESQIIFTAGGTESDHLALLSVLTRPQKGSILISAIEHPALREMESSAKSAGWSVIKVNPDKNGFIHKEDVIAALKDDTAFVSVMAVNNETGAVQDIYGIADALVEHSKGKRKPFFHTDCVQAAGKIELDLNHNGIDSAAFSAHKIHGPRATGLLYVKSPINSFLKGGGQEQGIRSGTESLFGAKAFALCLERYFIRKEKSSTVDRLNAQKLFTQRFIKRLLSIKGCRIIPECREAKESQNEFSPWIVQAAFLGIPGQVMLRALSEKGFYISTGSACSSKKHSRPVLDTMNLSPALKESAVRFSFGFSTTEDEMQKLASAVEEVSKVFNAC